MEPTSGMPGFRGSKTAGSQRGSRVQWRLGADYECLKGQMQAGRTKIKRTPCREGTMDATCRKRAAAPGNCR